MKNRIIKKKIIRIHKNATSHFIMICAIHEILVLLKFTRILKDFLRSIIEFYFFKIKIINFFHTI